jgi:Na+/melibiose symporter-like transporter
VGHFFNDLTAACWFNFLLYYLKRVVKTPSATTMFFVGQITDGIATPTIGYLSDKFRTRYGTK